MSDLTEDLTFGSQRKMFTALDTHEIAAGNDSMEDGLMDYATTGVASGLVSAGVGILNTGIALGETIGLVDTGSQIEEGDAINSILGADAASFYSRHKTGVDAFGLVAGSLLPGLGAIRGLRMLQTAGKVSSPLQAATGLRNADLVMNSAAVESAKRAALETTTAAPNWFAPHMIKAYGTGFKQQVMESFAFEAGVLATMNQNATLNPDDLSYFTAIGDQFWDATKFALAGGVLGGAIDGLRIVGAVRKNATAEWNRTSDLSVLQLHPQFDTGLNPGSKIIDLGRESARRAELEKAIDPNDWFAKRRFNAGTEQLKSKLLATIGETNEAGTAGFKAIEGLVNSASTGQLESVVDVVAGMKSISHVDVKDMEAMQEFYRKTAAPFSVSVGESAADVATQMLDTQQEFMRLAKRINPNLDVKLSADKLLETFTANKNTAGFAIGSGKLPQVPSQPYNVRVANVRGVGEIAFVPDVVGLNESVMKASYDDTVKFHKLAGSEFKQTYDQYTSFVLLHELAHLKNNGPAATRLVRNAIDMMQQRGESFKVAAAQAKLEGGRIKFNRKSGEEVHAQKVLSELISASIEARGAVWSRIAPPEFNAMSLEKKTRYMLRELMDPTNTMDGWDDLNIPAGRLNYLGNPAELLADGVALMTNPATRELASRKYKTVAQLISSEGGIAKAWNPTEAYFVPRTGEVRSSHLPGIADVDLDLKVVSRPTETILKSAKLDKEYKFNSELFTDAAIRGSLGSAKTRLDYLEYDAQWIMADRMKLQDMMDAEGKIYLAKENLPVMEKIAQLKAAGDKQVLAAFEKGNVMLNGQPVLADALPELVKQRKQDLRLLLAGTKQGYNEHEIAKILNVDLPHAIGISNANEDGWLLLGKKDYTKPEVFKVNYDRKSMKDYETATATMAGVTERNNAVTAQTNLVASELLGGNFYSLLPEVDPTKIGSVNPFQSRAGLFNNLRSEIGTLREDAQYIGKLVSQQITNVVEKVDTGMASHASIFNRSENRGLRFELATVDNLLRREWYYLAESASGAHIVRKDAIKNVFEELAAETGENFKFSPEMLKDLHPDILNRLDNSDPFAPGFMKLSDEVANFYRQHLGSNSSIVGRKKEVAKLMGRQATLDENVLYPPPRDLRTSKYFGFVIPKVFTEGHDARQFMVFGETQAEFEAKRLAIEKKHGTNYRILTKNDRAEYEQVMKGYEDGTVFDELEFDSELFRKGTASELAPNVDLNSSATLERYRVWTIKQEEALLRKGVELKYSGLVSQLKSLDKHYGNVEESAMVRGGKEPATIFRDTLATMLNVKSRGTTAEQGWVRVNDWMGEKGSQFMENVSSVFSKLDSQPLTQEMLDGYNAKLAEAGYKSPFDAAAEVILASPDTIKSNAFPSLVRTFSNLISTTMLRLDMANSMMQLFSTPILMLPVLQEAKMALKGTAAGERLKGATNVLNPATGELEPTSVKLMTKAVKEFFTPEGKEFLQQLRDRNIVSDHLSRYLEVTDMSQLHGRHTMKAVNAKIEALAHWGGKVSRHQWAEEFSRFVVAKAVDDIAKIRGLPETERWSVISGSVDKVHGVYAGAQRPQLFQGVLGQSVGLFQTYFFNFAQNMMKYTADGNKRQAAVMLGMQTSLFGIQSLPGFQTLNAEIGKSNRENEDLYTITGADTPKAWANYAMYGAASHMFGGNVDFTTRGSLAARNMLIIPTQFQDLPIVGTISKALGNIKQTVDLATEGDVSAGRAILHGLAHNSLNRPLQGVAQIVMGEVDSGLGQVQWTNANRIDHNFAADISWSAMFARAIGTRPLNETIINNAYFRSAAYKANVKRELAEIGGKIQMGAESGLAMRNYGDFAADYEQAGGEIQNFNAYWGRQLKASGDGVMNQFQREIDSGGNTTLSRASTRMELRQTTSTPWSTDY